MSNLELGKSEIVKCIQAASAVRVLCISREALCHSIDAPWSHLKMYHMEVWSILCEQDTCVALVKELEEALVAEESTDKEVEIMQEKALYEAKRAVVVQQEVAVQEDQGRGESGGVKEGDEEEDKPVHLSGLLAKVKGKHLVQ